MSAPTKVLLCAPTTYSLRYAINPWMLGPQVDVSLAQRQFDSLVGCYEHVGLSVDIIEQDPTLPDMVFTANAGLAVNGVFIPSVFRYPERASEALLFTEHFRNAGFEIKHLASGCTFEGAGDALFCGRELFLGFGFRTSFAAKGALSEFIGGCPIIPLGLSNPYFYHLDTCLSPLPSGRFIYFPDAFEDRSRKVLESRAGYPVTERFCVRYGCNMVIIDDVIITGFLDDHMREIARAEGLHSMQLDVSEFMKAGGGVRCLSFLY